jgi:hypothetical protein
VLRVRQLRLGLRRGRVARAAPRASLAFSAPDRARTLKARRPRPVRGSILRMAHTLRLVPCACVVALAVWSWGCGGDVIAEPGTGGGSASSSTGTGASTSTSVTATTTNGTATTTSTGAGPCDTHEDCPGALCHFATGTCVPACESGSCDSCGPGAICNGCATSSCPKCDDCLGACVPITEPGRCDDDDGCLPAEVCIFGTQRCAAACSVNADCPGGFDVCEPCVTGSCCGCENCVSACVLGD